MSRFLDSVRCGIQKRNRKTAVVYCHSDAERSEAEESASPKDPFGKAIPSERVALGKKKNKKPLPHKPDSSLRHEKNIVTSFRMTLIVDFSDVSKNIFQVLRPVRYEMLVDHFVQRIFDDSFRTGAFQLRNNCPDDFFLKNCFNGNPITVR